MNGGIQIAGLPVNLPDRRGVLLCSAWIAAVLLAGALLWFGTASYRQRLLIKEVNYSLEQIGDARRMEAPLAAGLPSMENWFTVAGSAGRACVFFMLRHSSAALCVAFTDAEGRVKTIVPLGENAGQLAGELPLPLYRFYADRIEKSAGALP